MKNLVFVLLIVLSATSSIKAQELTLYPGLFGYNYYEDSEKITRSEFNSRIKTNDLAYDYWRKHKSQFALSGATFVAGVGLVSLASILPNHTKEYTLATVGGYVTLGTSLIFMISTNKLRAKAILEYNSTFDISSIRMGITPSGVGLVCTF